MTATPSLSTDTLSDDIEVDPDAVPGFEEQRQRRRRRRAMVAAVIAIFLLTRAIGGYLSDNPEAYGSNRADGTGDVHLYESTDHHGNFLDCIKTRKLPICDVAIGHRSASVCHLGNIAIRTGRKLTWDPVKEEIVGDQEAAAMVSRPYRSPWSISAASS